MAENLLDVKRKLVAGDHKALRENIPRVNHVLSDLQPKWRKFGKAGISILEKREYQLVKEKRGSNLANASAESLVNVINRAIIPKIIGGNQPATFDVVGVDFFGTGPFLSIAYLLDAEQVLAERERIETLLENMGGMNLYLKDIDPHVSVASIEAINAEQRVLDAYGNIAPERFRFDPAKAFDH